MSVVSCSLSVVSCSLSVVRCQLSVVSCSLFVVSCQLSVVSCQLFVVSCQLSVVSCQLFVVSCSLSVVRCQLSVVRCSLFVTIQFYERLQKIIKSINSSIFICVYLRSIVIKILFYNKLILITKSACADSQEIKLFKLTQVTFACVQYETQFRIARVSINLDRLNNHQLLTTDR
ncbi:MAG: hypothetical protein ACKPFD_19265 [Dolichospermum sp.]